MAPAFQASNPVVSEGCDLPVACPQSPPTDNKVVLPAVKGVSSGFLPAAHSTESDLVAVGKENNLGVTLVLHPRTRRALVPLSLFQWDCRLGMAVDHTTLGSCLPWHVQLLTKQPDREPHSRLSRDVGNQGKPSGKDSEQPRGEGSEELEECYPCIGCT